jgi:hypothetical protein
MDKAKLGNPKVRKTEREYIEMWQTQARGPTPSHAPSLDSSPRPDPMRVHGGRNSPTQIHRHASNQTWA